ncbi:MAG TPA: phosphotriesterase-related protein [Mycobacteriales bacterium]|nr:phosphotriesterase-related protein [Mycobacteriales bacterium]
MSEIPTAGGPIDIGALGRTLIHEHVFVMTTEVQANFKTDWDEDRNVADAIEKLTALKQAGIDTIVDPTVIGLGRYLPRIVDIARQVEINIIVATGVYTYDELPRYFRMRGPFLPGLEDRPDPMVDMFVTDLTEGIGDTGVRAAFLKCAIDEEGMKPGVERVLRAVAKAHLRTGAPVMVHTHPGTHRGLEVHQLLRDEGVDPRSVCLAHSGDSGDADHLSELAEHGYLLGMDRFGVDFYRPFEERVETVAELIRRGYGDRMALAHDASCYFDWVEPRMLEAAPNWNYLHISRDVLPALREKGVTDAQIETLLVVNPRRWFETAHSR